MYLLLKSFVHSLGYANFLRSGIVAFEDAKIMTGHRKILHSDGCIKSLLLCLDV